MYRTSEVLQRRTTHIYINHVMSHLFTLELSIPRKKMYRQNSAANVIKFIQKLKMTNIIASQYSEHWNYNAFCQLIKWQIKWYIDDMAYILNESFPSDCRSWYQRVKLTTIPLLGKKFDCIKLSIYISVNIVISSSCILWATTQQPEF